MKVTCEYCGSYVEADENMRCPFCLAGLGSAVQAEQQRLAAQEQAEQQRIAEEEAQVAKENRVSEIIKGVTSVATAIAAGSIASGTRANAQPPASGTPLRPHFHDRGHRPPTGGPGGPGGPHR